MNHLTVYTLILQLAIVNIFRSKNLLTELKYPTTSYYNIEIIINNNPFCRVKWTLQWELPSIHTNFFSVQQFHLPENRAKYSESCPHKNSLCQPKHSTLNYYECTI